MKTIAIFEKNFKEKNINKIIIKYINFKSILLCFYMLTGCCGDSSLFRKYKTEERNHDKRK